MGRVSVETKEYKGKTYYTSTYLAKKLYLSPERSRAILQGFEHNSELGTNPKFFDLETIEKVINDYNSNDIKSQSLIKRKEKREKARAELEKDLYDNATPMTADAVTDWYLVQQRIEKDLVPTMLKNLFAALGHEFDMETFYIDVEKVESYKRSAGNYGLPRPQEVVEAEDRLLSNNSYLK
ncbi:hypothetical protein PFZ59_04955 [Streptococcus suis]|uniref:hypothetical protein n=1 Tax=Streptococcus suis TaxID=1307 RepID=UPI001ABE4DDF|nr:hypothetical protein [Streptococcus suis]MBO4127962.1 hypothetical protein [Streptococcus suis]WFA76782.1 hypothetical protein PFZ59_04955 [Streptococcus suis]